MRIYTRPYDRLRSVRFDANHDHRCEGYLWPGLYCETLGVETVEWNGISRSMRVHEGPEPGTPVVTENTLRQGFHEYWTVREDGHLVELPYKEIADIIDPKGAGARRYWRACRAFGLTRDPKKFVWPNHDFVEGETCAVGSDGAWATATRVTPRQVWLKAPTAAELAEVGIEVFPVGVVEMDGKPILHREIPGFSFPWNGGAPSDASISPAI